MTTAKLVSGQSVLTGEVTVLTDDDTPVPFAPGFNLEALKAVDDDPFFVTVEIIEGTGQQGDGVYYDGDILKSIVEQINERRPPGYKGHQDPNEVAWGYREPVTAWVGADHSITADGRTKIRVKGYVPQTASDLRTQLRLAESGADIVNSVSIWGMRTEDGDRVTDFDLWSLDWTPKGRAGMDTELVGVSGEQTTEDDVVTRDEVIASLKADEVPEHIATALRDEGVASVTDDSRIAGEMRVIFELEDGDADAVIEAVSTLVSKSDIASLAAKVDEAIGEQVEVPLAREAVKAAVLGSLGARATEEEITGEITSILERPYIKALVDGNAIPTVQGGGKPAASEDRQASVWT